MRDSQFPVSIKTSAPSLKGVIERRRLLDALSKLQAPAKWLLAPSGTGKSTLAASYARAAKKPLVWYRLDERDNDPAFFYAEFAEAIRSQARLTKQVPKFSSDDHDRQQAFAQRFASAITEQPAKPTLFVLDDVQTIANEAMQQALAALVAATAKGHELLFVSQSTAPTAFFDSIAARQLALLNDADLHFDLAECSEMISGLRITGAHGQSIAALTGGHAGALILACELLRGTDPQSALGVETLERVHSHLLTKLVERMPPPRRELLLQTAFVTQLTRLIAEQLAGKDAAAEIDALVESGLLRRVGSVDSDSFEAHGLVQQGMRALAHRRFKPAQTRDLAEKTATILVSHGQVESAFAILTEIGSTERAIAVLQQLAVRYAAQGQVDLLMGYIAKLPPKETHRNAWLCFWAGQALLRVDEEQARTWFAYSYTVFETEGTKRGMRLAAASMVTAFQLECRDLRELDHWVDRHTQAGGDTPISLGDPFETTLIMGIICGAFVRAAYPPQIDPDALTLRLQSLLDVPSVWLSDDQRVQAARLLIENGRIFAKFAQAASAITASRSLIADSVGGALHRGRWLIITAMHCFATGDATGSARHLNEARVLAEQSQSTALSFELGLAFAEHWMKLHDLQRATDELANLEILAAKVPAAQRAEFAKMMTRLLLLQERPAEGLRWAEEALRIAEPAGFTGVNLRAYEIELIYALAANERLAEAVELTKQHPSGPRLAIELCLRFLLERETQVELLREGLQVAARLGFVNLLDRARGVMARICAAALANDIEASFVRQVIELKRLEPPPLAGASWPWPVRIFTLGGFRLDIHGERYRPTHKAQDKPLELLKLLVTCLAMGRASAERTWISERLWPDSAAENARKSLEMTLARLRRLLGNDDFIVAYEGRLQLAPQLVWTDIQPLQYALSRLRTRRDDYAAGKLGQMHEAAACVRAVLEHYAGPYLADEDGPPWLLAGRESILTMVRQALLAAESMLDGTADKVLIPALEKALAADPASEDLARSLMRALIRQGQNSEAVRVYRQLRQMLSLLLAVAPSEETDDIRDQAYAAESKT